MQKSRMGQVRVVLLAAAMLSAVGGAWAKGGGGAGGAGAGCGDGGGVGSGDGGGVGVGSSGDSAGAGMSGVTVGTWVPRYRRGPALAALPAPVVDAAPVATAPSSDGTRAMGAGSASLASDGSRPLDADTPRP